MPTPNEEVVAVLPTPSTESNVVRASCPPEEERQHSRPSRARPSRADSSTLRNEHTTNARRQMPTPEPESSTSEEDEVEKAEHIADAAVQPSITNERTDQLPSPVSSPDAPASQEEGYSAQAVTRRANESSRSLSEDEDAGPRYLTYPSLQRYNVRPAPLSPGVTRTNG